MQKAEKIMKTKIKQWYLNREHAKRDAANATNETGVEYIVHPLNRGWKNYYIVASVEDVVIRLMPQTDSKRLTKFWNSCNFIFKGTLVRGASIRRVHSFLRKKKDLDGEAIEYLQGHRTPAEYWGKNINERMEAARISHYLCDLPGIDGHRIRQQIRRQLLS